MFRIIYFRSQNSSCSVCNFNLLILTFKVHQNRSEFEVQNDKSYLQQFCTHLNDMKINTICFNLSTEINFTLRSKFFLLFLLV